MRGSPAQATLPVATVVGLAVLLWTAQSLATVPERLHYQGYLTTSSGQPVECLDPAICDEPIDLTFRIYADPVADALLWEEEQLGVIVVAGVFNVLLGETDPLTPEIFDGPAFLGVEINENGELLPRQEIVSAAFALRCAEAINAQLLGGILAQDYVTVADVGQLQGPQGEDGIPGDTGPQGPPGPPGDLSTIEAQISSLTAQVDQLTTAVEAQDNVNIPLIGNNHTAQDCIDAGGIVETITTGESLCRFSGSTCPPGWNGVDNWSTTSTCLATGSGCSTQNQCLSGGHPFSNTELEFCCAQDTEQGSGPCQNAPNKTCCFAVTVEKGCQ